MEPPAFQVEPWLEVLPAEAAHAEALADLIGRNIEHLGRYLPPVAEVHTPEAARAHLADVVGKMARGELLQWHLFADGALCGVLRLNYFEPLHRKAALSYFLGAEHQGRGIVTRAARVVLGYAFEQLNLHRIELRCDTRNQASMRVAERLGFTREGELREAELLWGHLANLYVYGLLRPEFRGQS
jgi:ribosomal-protein-serine acetyltransferase